MKDLWVGAHTKMSDKMHENAHLGTRRSLRSVLEHVEDFVGSLAVCCTKEMCQHQMHVERN